MEHTTLKNRRYQSLVVDITIICEEIVWAYNNQQKSWKYDVKLHHRATETIFELIYLGRQILILKPTVVVDGNLRTDKSVTFNEV